MNNDTSELQTELPQHHGAEQSLRILQVVVAAILLGIGLRVMSEKFSATHAGNEPLPTVAFEKSH